jgi:dihydrofolate reductase
MKLNIITAMTENRIISREGRIPWRLADDLRSFKAITYHHPVIMGRKTYESIGKILYGRRNIILTRSHFDKKAFKEKVIKREKMRQSDVESNFVGIIADLNSDLLRHRWDPDVTICSSKEEVLEVISRIKDPKVGHNNIPFVIGGRQVYKLFFDMVERLFVTIIHKELEGDLRFPSFSSKDFECIYEQEGYGHPKHTFTVFLRK